MNRQGWAREIKQIFPVPAKGICQQTPAEKKWVREPSLQHGCLPVAAHLFPGGHEQSRGPYGEGDDRVEPRGGVQQDPVPLLRTGQGHLAGHGGGDEGDGAGPHGAGEHDSGHPWEDDQCPNSSEGFYQWTMYRWVFRIATASAKWETDWDVPVYVMLENCSFLSLAMFYTDLWFWIQYNAEHCLWGNARVFQ